jgi:murein DD-endopeptidase MepM/ murein hydrolase activator NlpD
MERNTRNWILAATLVLVCAFMARTAAADRSGAASSVGAAAGKARAKLERKAKKKKGKKSKKERKRSRAEERAKARAEAKTPLAARLHAAWVRYEALADWQLRGDLDPSTFSLARRAVSLTVALAGARPGAAMAAMLGPEPPLLEQRPVAGRVSSGYGVRRDPFRRRNKKKHNGIDLRARRGVAVHAAGPGTVAKAERMRGYGRVVYLDHGKGVQTRYAHLQRIAVREGEFVPPGGLVGKVGSTGRATGPHLHFEVRRYGRPVAPIEIIGLLATDASFADWLMKLPRRMIAAAGGDVDATPAKKSKPRKKRGKRRARSKRPNS